jgi:hypothetical protein
MALNKRGVSVNQSQLASEMYTSEEYNGTLLRYMSIPFQKQGLGIRNETVNIDTLKAHISKEELVILFIFYDSDLTDYHYVLAVG